jgi:putative ABC transport system ATP-binding protein
MSIIEARGLTKTFGAGESIVNAVSDVSIHVGAGEIVLLLGPSVSDKTPLVSMLGVLLTPTHGIVEIAGVGLLRAGKDSAGMRLRSIGFVFQSFNLLAGLTALENVALPLRLLGVRRSIAADRARALLESLGLARRVGALPGTLSGGEKQRVSIARALVAEPRLLLADEPTASLDTQTGREAIEVLRLFIHEGGQGCVVVTHDTRLIDLADRVMHIEDGRLIV